ncbi:MAG: hypothetical protein RIR69_371 [Actinomycetota bacterium]|jgi:hypothetical protein
MIVFARFVFRHSAVAVVITLATVLATGCSASSNSVQEQNSSTSSIVAPETNSLTYELVGGGTFDLTRGANAEPIALWFWAPG